MFDQDWVNDSYGQGSGATHKVDAQPGQPICGRTLKHPSQLLSKTRVRWSKVTCPDCLKLAPNGTLEQMKKNS